MTTQAYGPLGRLYPTIHTWLLSILYMYIGLLDVLTPFTKQVWITYFLVYNRPNPTQSFIAEVIISFISSPLQMWTGIFTWRSQVDVVGRHLQFSLQPCTKVRVNFLGKPRTGTNLVPDIHFISIKMVMSPVKDCDHTCK
jgi:hypothetical protein